MKCRMLIYFLVAAVPLTVAQKCLPGQPCFPSKQQLKAFNASVSGALLAPAPYGNVCYSGTWNAQACASLVASKSSPEFRASLPAAVQYTNNEFNEYGQGCPVPDVAPSAPLEGSCVLGSMVNYAVNVSTTSQIVKTIQFVEKHNLELVIKNTGHDYLGRSTEAGGFSIWTEHLKDKAYVPNFVPAGCHKTMNVVQAAAGNNIGDLYSFADANGVLVNGGYNPTVGGMGGYWLLGGLGSIFGPELGYGSDRIVQFELVLASGTTVIASECQNVEMYAAVKGGGAVFGVVTQAWLLAAPKPQAVNAVFATFAANSSTSYSNLITALVDNSATLRNPADLTSCLVLAVDSVVEMLCPKIFNQTETVVSAETTASLFAPLQAVSGVTSNITALQFPTFYEAYLGLIEPIVTKGAPVGLSLIETSRALNNETLYTNSGRQNVKDFLLAVNPAQTVIIEWNGGFACSNPPTNGSSVNPVFRDSIGYIVVPVFSNSTGPTTAVQNSTIDALGGLMDQHFGITSYPNEDNVRASNYQERYWGANYPFLLAMQQKLDPKGVFSCKSCVGSN